MLETFVDYSIYDVQPPPTLENPADWSPAFNDFVAKCLTKDPDARPTSLELLMHPFVATAGGNKRIVHLPFRKILICKVL